MSKTIERKVDHLTTPKPTKASVIVTTSWDDGHRLDTRLAELLQSYGLQATFYLAPQNREIVPGDLLDEAQVRELASHFEIGSHTLTHPVLTALDGGQIDHELSESRRVLQDMTGQAVESFCYPRGIYNARVASHLPQAGYRYGRTTERYITAPAANAFQSGTTLEAHRPQLPRLPWELYQIAKASRWSPLGTLRRLDWEQLAMAQFDHVLAHGGVFHLWGHSWVVDTARQWDKLSRVLDYVHGHEGVRYISNIELVETKS